MMSPFPARQQVFAVFGYGSLVNLATLHDPPMTTARARVSGWQRRWLRRPSPSFLLNSTADFAFLSAEPTSDPVQIDGRFLFYSAEHIPALDRREALYDRVSLDPDAIEWLDDPSEIAGSTSPAIYSAQQPVASRDQVILRSYLDAVLQGYWKAFGSSGLERFLQTTAPRDMKIFEDREEPIYPRAVTLTQQEQDAIELALDRAG